MQAVPVTVYHAKDVDTAGTALFIHPTGSEPIVSEHHQAFTWKHLASTTMDDQLFAYARPIIEAQFDAQGYAFVRLDH